MRRFERFLLLIPIALAPAALRAQATPAAAAGEATTVVIVRHAEKAAEPADDPPLTLEGEARAGALARVVAGSSVVAIYTTQYRRTRQTADSVAARSGVSVTVRPATRETTRTYAADLAREIFERHPGGTVIVVGHSNTVPGIVEALSGRTVPSIADPEYDQLYVVVRSGAGPARLVEARYGKPSGPKD